MKLKGEVGMGGPKNVYKQKVYKQVYINKKYINKICRDNHVHYTI